MFFSREVISRIVLIIMAVAVLSSSLMAKPQAMYNVQDTTSVSEQHDSDEPLNEHDPLLLHSHGNVHHLNADHSHDLNKLFTLTALQAWNAGMRATFALSSEQILRMPQATPERPPRSLSA